jgi:Mg2+ and Co2+ transporter CorA
MTERKEITEIEAKAEELEANIVTDQTKTPAPPKYSVVLRFWNTPFELDIVDIVSCQNRFTKANFVKFIDTDGRMWDNVPQDDVLLITNCPGKEDIEDFMRLKRETVELNKLIASKKPDMDDVSIR